MINIYCFNNTIVINLWIAFKLTARDNCFDKIQSILIDTNIEKPPNSFLAVR